MTLTQLRYFQTACRLRNITQAARRLHVSQPSVSIAIRELEDEFGLMLLDRSGRAFSLTAEGVLFLEQADGLLAHADDFRRSMGELSASHRALRLGIPPMIGAILLPRLLRDSGPDQPQLTVTELGGKELFTQLDNRQIDMAFIPHRDPLPGKYRSLPVLEVETVCCVADPHPLAGRETVSVRELAGEPLDLLFKDGAFHTEAVLDRFRQEEITPNILIQTGQLSTVRELVTQGRAAGFLFSPIAASLPGVAGVPLAPPLTAQVSLVWNKGDYLSKLRAAFLDMVRRLLLTKETTTAGR